MKSLSIITILLTISISVIAQNSHIQVVSEPGISVFLDGQFKGVTSSDYGGLVIQNVTTGQHTIKVVKDGYSPQEEEINVKEGEVLQYNIANAFTPAIQIFEEGNKEKQALSIKKGNLTIQSLPIRIRIQISSIGINYIKQEDKFHAENIPEGTYISQFRWKDKTLSDTIQIQDKMVTYLFVNMVELKIENKDYKYIEEQTPLQDANARARGAFSNAGNAGTSSKSQGLTGGTGNQGVASGTPDAPNYGPGGGTGTGVISFELGGRKAQSLFKPTYDLHQVGVVVVAITVDRSGRVTDATPGIKGSTTLDGDLLKLAKEAALSTKFVSNSGAPVIQKGTITYVFRQK